MLEEKQFLFSIWASKLVAHAFDAGFSVTLGEVWRSPETAKAYAAEGKGICHSEHTLRLAIDICLFRGGVYLTSTADYASLGTWWKSQSVQLKDGSKVDLCWGGDFSRADGNHFSFEHNGIK